jgi:peptidoglycan/xylan/chitin deacetylase (PgdA/CDA1 family)
MILSFLNCHRPANSDVRNLKMLVQQPGHEIPVLCYHNIRSALDDHSPELTVTVKTFDDQIKMLHDSGYHTIVPDQLYNYVTRGSALPARPIMLTFDDSHEEHFSIAANEMKKYGFRGVFFVMTIAIDKPHYLSSEEIRALSGDGNTIACHTYDHPLLTRLPNTDWSREIDEPKRLLEKITGKPVDYFAYPYGAWNEKAVEELKERGIKAAFQLSEQQSVRDPLFTIRRIMVSDAWSVAKLNDEIHFAFNQRNFARLEEHDIRKKPRVN